MKDFVVYSIRNWRRRKQLVTKLTGTADVPSEQLLNAIRNGGVRFKIKNSLLSDGEVLNYILKERGEE